MNKKFFFVAILIIFATVFLWLIYSYKTYNFVRKVGFDKNKYELIKKQDEIGGDMSIYRVLPYKEINILDVPSELVAVKNFTNSEKFIQSYITKFESISSCLEMAAKIENFKYPKIEFNRRNFYENLNEYYISSDEYLVSIKCVKNNNVILLLETKMPNLKLEKINNLNGIDDYVFGNTVEGLLKPYIYYDFYKNNNEFKIAKNKYNEIYSVIKIKKFIKKEDCLSEFSNVQSEIKKQNFVKPIGLDFNLLNVKYMDDRYLIKLSCSKDEENVYKFNYLVTDSNYSDMDYFLLKERIIEFDNLNTNVYKK